MLWSTWVFRDQNQSSNLAHKYCSNCRSSITDCGRVLQLLLNILTQYALHWWSTITDFICSDNILLLLPFIGATIDSLHNASLEANWSWPHAATFNFTPRSFALARGSLLCRGEATLPGGFNHWIGSVLHRGCRACWTTSQRGALKLQWGNVTLACKSFAPHTCFFFLIWRLAFSRPPPSLAHQLRLCQLFSRSLAPPTWPTGCKSTHRPCWSRATHRLHWKSICTSYWAFWGSPACPSCRCAPPLR